MSEKTDFENVQRRNSAVMAKYEWTSSLMSMQKSGNEIHDRRTKTHRKANEFLQELLQKRSDGSLLDDNGTLDRYRKFLKFKSNLNDDDILHQFDQRLRALNKNRRNQTSITNDLQISRNTEIDIQPLKSTDRIISNNSLLSNLSSQDKQTNIHFNINEDQSTTPPLSSSSSSSLLLEQSTTSLSNHSITKTLHKPKVRRADGTEIIVTTNERRLRRASSDILIFHYCHFPRSLKSREHINNNNNIISEKNISHSPSIIKQYDKTQLFHLLDEIENECSPINFTAMLDQLTLSSIQTHPIENNISIINEHENENEENIFINSNLFDQSTLSHEYYTTFDINIDEPKKIFLYTMTIGIVQLSPSLIVPYSILNGRRPLLQSSVETNFRKIHSKQLKHISSVTAIESLTNTELLRENDIILKINDQSVWHLTTETIRNILQHSNNCVLTVARLCQPFI